MNITATPAEMQATAPVLSWLPNYHGHPSIRMTWDLAPGPDGKIERANVHISHYGGAKQFVATAFRSTFHQGPEASSDLSSPMDWKRLDTEGVKRYSRKAHIEFAKRVEAKLADGAYAELAYLWDTATPGDVIDTERARS